MARADWERGTAFLCSRGRRHGVGAPRRGAVTGGDLRVASGLSVRVGDVVTAVAQPPIRLAVTSHTKLPVCVMKLNSGLRQIPFF